MRGGRIPLADAAPSAPVTTISCPNVLGNGLRRLS